MTIGNFDLVFFTVSFLVPGFVWSSVLTMLLPRRQAGKEMRFLEFLTLSCINHGLWSWALFLMFRTGFVDHHPDWSAVFLVGIIFVSPIVLGLVTGKLQQTEAVAGLLRWL